MILEVLRVKGSRFTAVASQLHTWSRNEDQEGALTWSVHLSSYWAKLDHLLIWRCCKNLMLNGQAKIALA